jgi:radical SAM superfamily enzyme YgiQ (UPF0313 family)
MKAPGAILLVSCYELGHQPLAVAWPAAVLEREGYRPSVLDVSVERFEAERAARARLVAISVPMHTALRVGVRVAERVRAVNAGCHICFFGLYAGLNAGALLGRVADSVIAGEPEQPLARLARALETGEPGPVPGVSQREPWARPTPARHLLPPPSRRGLPGLERYARVVDGGGTRLAGYVEATRGCLHRCRHCPIPPVYEGRFVAIPRDVVQADIRQQVAAGAGHITFGDPDFLNGPGQALGVARALHREFPRVTFDFTAKIEHLLRRRRVLPELKALGCLFIVSAAESLSDTVLAILDKGHTRRDVIEALGLVRGAGIALRPTWLPFTPWTTLEDYRDVLGFVAGEGLVDHVDPVQYALRLLIPPGSLLLGRPELEPHLEGLAAEDFSYRWRHPDARMEALYEAVAAAVRAGVERGEDAPAIFDRVAALADEAAGAGPSPAAARRPAADRARPPRLTEPWFC